MKKITAIITLCAVLTIISNVIHADECETEVTTAIAGSIGTNTVQAVGCIRWWHKGAWHESVAKPGKHGYMQNGKFVELSPTEVAASKAKQQQFWKDYDRASDAKKEQMIKQFNAK